MKWEWLRNGLIVVGILVIAGIVVINLPAVLSFARPPAETRSGASRELLYVVPRGTIARVGLGGGDTIFPSQIDLTLGVQDTLVIRNEDTSPIEVGGVYLHPGQVYRQAFTRVGTYELLCSVHGKDKIRIIVNPPSLN